MSGGRIITPNRLEAFSDGVIAIIITIMVLELKVPHGTSPRELFELWPIFLSYALSYLYVAIYWMNHHHLMGHIKKVDNTVLWANMLLLYCISYIPFWTAYMGENRMTPFSTAMYAGALLVCALSFFVLGWAVGRHLNDDAALVEYRKALYRKNLVAIGIYVISVPMSYVHPSIGLALVFVVALMYFLPNAWVEKMHADKK